MGDVVTRTGRPNPSNLRKRNRLRSASLLLTTLALTTAAGCSSGDAADPKPSPTPPASQSATPADPAEAAKKEVVAVYLSYWQEMEKLYADSSGKSAYLKSFAASVALSSAEADAKSTHARKLIHTGEVSVGSPTVTKLDMDRKIPNASLGLDP